MKKLVAVFCIAAMSTILVGGTFSADRNISFISGSISKIDTTAPGNVKVEVVNDADGKSHLIDIGTGANILKVVEVGELKVGDKARIVAKKTGDKETALSVVTGKLKEMAMRKDQAKK